MISKLIKNDNTKSGYALSVYNPVQSILNAKKNAEGVSFSSDFSTSLIKDIDAITRYTDAVNNGKSTTEAFNLHMGKASANAHTFAKGIEYSGNKLKLTRADLIKFGNDSRVAELSNLSLNTSLQNCASIINEYNGGFKNTKLSQEDFITAVGSSNHVLGNYLSGLNGAPASIGGYIKALIGAKAATIGLQTASMALDAVIGIGIGVAITLISKAIHYYDDLAEKVNEVKSEFNESQKEIHSHAKTIEDISGRYKQLSAGVDALGNNVSLTSGEFDEYCISSYIIVDHLNSYKRQKE